MGNAQGRKKELERWFSILAAHRKPWAGLGPSPEIPVKFPGVYHWLEGSLFKMSTSEGGLQDKEGASGEQRGQMQEGQRWLLEQVSAQR